MTPEFLAIEVLLFPVRIRSEHFVGSLFTFSGFLFGLDFSAKLLSASERASVIPELSSEVVAFLG